MSAAAIFAVAVTGTLLFGFLRGGSAASPSLDEPTAVAAPAGDVVRSPGAITETPTDGAESPSAVEAPVPLQGAPVGYDIDSASSVTVVVNKARPLAGGSSYIPENLAPAGGGEVMRADAATALTALYDAAELAGHELSSVSGYRSYATQESTYGGYVAS
ncbi:D-alanyl-D-alanine carboxypeptidase family protein [Pseudoclavibacter helvolus]|uniref:D-alanyl-D-alanine carboxypeptidase family protein n=1 Tax=Pseudoclavibacter helvolus TaxID=255205 RepID=UPI0037366C54